MTQSRYTRTVNVLTEVMEERERQDRLWGEQHLPFHHREDGRGVGLTGRSYAAWALMYQAECDRRRADVEAGGSDTRSNALVLLEEVFEALAATDLRDIRDELVQVAAVAVKAVEAIDRDRARGATAQDRKGHVRPCDVIVSELVTGAPDAPVRPAEPDTRTARPDSGRVGGTGGEQVCAADGCTPDYCPGGKDCVAIAPGFDLSGLGTDHIKARLFTDLEAVSAFERERLAVGTPPVDVSHRHDFDRLHGLCRCGEGPVIVDCYADDDEIGPDERRCWSLADHGPHDKCHGNGPLRRSPGEDGHA